MKRSIFLLAVLPVLAACATSTSSANGHAPAIIRNATLETVAFAAVDVFETHGWHVAEVQIDHDLLMIRSAPFRVTGIAEEYADCGISGVRTADEGEVELIARTVPTGGVQVSVRPRVVARDSYLQNPVSCLSTGKAEQAVMVALRASFGGN